MIKNQAGQKIGAQMISKTTGNDVTSGVTCYVTLDAGTQALGTVGSGACTHEGNGYNTYAPSQAETNGDYFAFTFIASGAVSETVHGYTSAAAPDVNVVSMATDSLSAAAVSAAAVTKIITSLATSTALAALVTTVGAAGAGLTALATATNLAAAKAVVDAIKVVTDKISTMYVLAGSVYRWTADALILGPVGGTGLDAAGTRAALGMSTANMDTQLSGITAKTSLIPASPAAVGDAMTLTSGERTTIATVYLDLAGAIDGYTPREAARLQLAPLAGKISGALAGAPSIVLIRAANDSKTRINATTDINGNRTIVVLDAT